MRFRSFFRITCPLVAFVALASTPDTLREAANTSGVPIGTAVRPYLLSEPAYSATLAHEFNMVEPEDALKWWTIRPTAESFDFKQGDQIVGFAEAHGIKVRGHCLVWDHNNPKWLAQGHFSPAQLSKLLHEHITTVKKHYAGHVFAWDVVNEGLDEKGTPRDSPWYNRPGIGLSDQGTAYIEQAFRWAHEADPKALCFTTRQRVTPSTANPTRSMPWSGSSRIAAFRSTVLDCNCTCPASTTISGLSPPTSNG